MDTALITGGTDGIGRAIARELASRRHHIIVVGRDGAKGESCVRALQHETASSAVEFIRADLSTIRGAEALSSEVSRRITTLRFLVHSAGLITSRRQFTTEGHEAMFATNFLSRYALTRHLLPALERGGRGDRRAHVLFVNGGPRRGILPYDRQATSARYSLAAAVRQYSLANDLFALHLDDQLRLADAPIDVVCLKLGPVKTAIRRGFPLWMKVLAKLVLDPIVSQTPEDVAAAAVMLMENRTASNREHVVFTKVSRLRPIQLDGRLAERRERERLAEWTDRMVAESRHEHP